MKNIRGEINNGIMGEIRRNDRVFVVENYGQDRFGVLDYFNTKPYPSRHSEKVTEMSKQQYDRNCKSPQRLVTAVENRIQKVHIPLYAQLCIRDQVMLDEAEHMEEFYPGIYDQVVSELEAQCQGQGHLLDSDKLSARVNVATLAKLNAPTRAKLNEHKEFEWAARDSVTANTLKRYLADHEVDPDARGKYRDSYFQRRFGK